MSGNFTFGDIVIVEGNLIGVVVKSWEKSSKGTIPAHHEVYVRSFNSIKEYTEDQMRRYLVRHKELDDDEMYYQDKMDNRGGGENSELSKTETAIKDYFKNHKDDFIF